MGVFDSPTSKARTSAWRFSDVNKTYEYCGTYPSSLVVPSKISDTTLNYGKNYRSKARIPGLVYLHWANLGSITRSSQPMVGLKNNRSIQDEKLIEAIFTSHSQHHSLSNPEMANASYIAHSQSQPVYGATPTNLIIDARPTTNAMANVAKGAGTENMDYYRNCKKVYLGIDNIHVMRDSLNKVAEATRYPDQPPNYELLRKSNWLKHLSAILEGIVIIVKAIHLANSHVLVHCSDGWDRTSQLSSLSQLCLDPYYRTKEGLAVLIEKDWVSFGHRFSDRCGHTVPSRVQCLNTSYENDESSEEEVGLFASFQQRLNFSSSSHLRETCPVFDQFLDVIHQLQKQFPSSFEFNDAFLLDIQKKLYDCSHGTFLYNSERERSSSHISTKTTSIWQSLLSTEASARYYNEAYDKTHHDVLFPDPRKVDWWSSWLKRSDLSSSDTSASVQPELPVPTVVETTADDPVLSNFPSTSKRQSNLASSDNGSQTRHGFASFDENSTPAQIQINARSLLDNQAVSSASTAVQGAMRSAWSAWKSVRTGYENAMREQQEGEKLASKLGSSNPHTSPSGFVDRPVVTSSLPIEDNIWNADSHSQTTNGKAVTPMLQEAVPPAYKQTASRNTNGLTRERADSAQSRQPQNLLTTEVEQMDPLGVNVWQ